LANRSPNVRQAWVKVGSLTGSGRHVLFIGDSNMQQYYPRIARILADHPLNTHSAVFATRGMCALVPSRSWGSFVQRASQHLAGDVRYGTTRPGHHCGWGYLVPLFC